MEINEKFGGKTEIKSLSAIKGIAADKITPEQLTAINAEMKELGFEGIEISAAGTLASVQGGLTTVTGENDANKATIAGHKTEIEAKDAKISSLEAEVKTLGGKKATDETTGGQKEDKIEAEDTKEFKFEGSASEKAMNEFFN